MRSYLMRVVIALDIFFNVVLGGKFGETISARVGLHQAWYDVFVAYVLNDIQPHHTELAKEHDEERDLETLKDLSGGKKRGL